MLDKQSKVYADKEVQKLNDSISNKLNMVFEKGLVVVGEWKDTECG